MWMLILEAGSAMLLLLFIVWWTMFAGKKTKHDMQQESATSENDASRKAE